MLLKAQSITLYFSVCTEMQLLGKRLGKRRRREEEKSISNLILLVSPMSHLTIKECQIQIKTDLSSWIKWSVWSILCFMRWNSQLQNWRFPGCNASSCCIFSRGQEFSALSVFCYTLLCNWQSQHVHMLFKSGQSVKWTPIKNDIHDLWNSLYTL